jgi:hypothetical protein
MGDMHLMVGSVTTNGRIFVKFGCWDYNAGEGRVATPSVHTLTSSWWVGPKVIKVYSMLAEK